MKAKITVTITREIDLDQDYFDPNTTHEERLSGEIQYAEDLFHEWCDADNVQWETKGEIIECGRKAIETNESSQA